jgi:TolB-like protein
MADAVGYSRLVGENESGTLDRFRADRDTVFLAGIAAFGGGLVKSLGDGHLIEFPSAVDALRFATGVQVAFAERSDPGALRYRIGIRLGDIVVEGEDILGDGVNVAARIEKLAAPGGIAVSGAVRDQARGKLALTFEALGPQAVHNIAEPLPVFRVAIDAAARALVAEAPARGPTPAPDPAPARIRARGPALALLAALALAAAALAVWQLRRRLAPPPASVAEVPAPAPAAAKPLVAVLPFDAIGEDPATERLARGLTEDIITDLARFPEFGVLARNSTEAYAGRPADPREVAAKLGAAFVLEGSVQQAAANLRITAQLIDARTGAHVWSERWDRPAADVFAIQSGTAETVANRLGSGDGLVQQTGRIAARRKAPADLDAYDFYLLGTEHLEKVTEADPKEALRLLSRAVELDPGLARAWVELYHTHTLLSWFGGDLLTSRANARAAAERAVALDPGDAEAHAVLAMSLMDAGNIGSGRREFDEALRLAPNSFEILAFYAGYAVSLDEPARGAEAADLAIRLNPDYPMWATGTFAFAYFNADRFGDVVAMLDRRDPATIPAGMWAIRASALAALGRDEEARAGVAEALRLAPGYAIETHIDLDRSLAAPAIGRFVRLMRKAGFPECAPAENRAVLWEKARLPDCETADPAAPAVAPIPAAP